MRTRAHDFAVCAVSAIAGLNAAICSGQILHVDDDARPGGNGRGWNSAFMFLQDAMFTAASDPTILEIRVGGGHYYPDQSEGGHVNALDRSATFLLRSNLAVRGGYRGLAGQGNANHRDPVAFESVLSGDLAGDDVGAANDPTHHENSFHIVNSNGTDASAVLDGFTLRGGMASGDGRDTWTGGGLFNDDGSPTVISCRFEANYAGSVTGAGNIYEGGGGIFNGISARPEIRDCTFRGNLISNGGSGGAIRNERGSNPWIVGCLFEDHTNIAGSGAVENEDYSKAVFEDCVFRRNSDTALRVSVAAEVTCLRCLFYDNGYGVSGDGGAVSIQAANVTLIDCVFVGNNAMHNGGAIFVSVGQLNVVSSVFSGNRADTYGGAIYATSSDVTVTNGTFTGNDAYWRGGGIYATGTANVEVWNSIFWRNQDSQGMGEASQNYWYYRPLVTRRINFSLVQGWTGREGGVGNFDGDPLFVNALGPDGAPGTPDDDVHLLAGSPCANTGHNGAPSVGAFDIDSEPRINGCRVDIGADETAISPAFADCNGNGVHDVCDVANETSLDCGNNYIPDECEPDCNGDGLPDSCDLLTGADTDCNENGIPDSCDSNAIPALAHDCDGNGVTDACEHTVVALFDDFPTTDLSALNWSSIWYLTQDVDVVGGGVSPPYCARLGAPGKLTTVDLNLFNAESAQLHVTDFGSHTGGTPAILWVTYWNVRLGWVRLLTLPSTSPGRWRTSIVDIPVGATLQPTARFQFIGGYPQRWRLDDISITYERGDCNLNGQRDDCDVLQGLSDDCNANTRPDECDIAVGFSADLDGFGLPDECHAFGDYDGDGTIARDDFDILGRCLAGPKRTPQPGDPFSADVCAAFFDSEGDGDVDLSDVARFGIGFTGPIWTP